MMDDVVFVTKIYTSPDGFTKVYKANWGTVPVAVKEMLNTPQAASEYHNQATLYPLPSVCRVYKWLTTDDGAMLQIVMEWMDHDLLNEIERRKGVPPRHWTEGELWTMFRTLIDTLALAQIFGIAHRDIKPQNVYMTAQGGVKIGDFGCSKMTNLESSQTLVGSPYFLSPELKKAFLLMMMGQPRPLEYDPYKSDVYSLGLMFLMMTLLRPSNEMMDLEMIEKTTMGVLALVESGNIRDLLGKMLLVDVNYRPDFVELKRYVDGLYGGMSEEYCSVIRDMISLKDVNQVENARKAIAVFPIPREEPLRKNESNTQFTPETDAQELYQDQPLKASRTDPKCDHCKINRKFTRCTGIGKASSQETDKANHNICRECIWKLFKDAEESSGGFHCPECGKKMPKKKIKEVLD